MGGINLSQSMQESRRGAEKKSFFDQGLIWGSVVLFLVAGAWGGLRWYMTTLDDKVAALEEELTSNASRLEGKSADRIADFNDRLTLIGTGLDSAAEPRVILEQMERLMVPEVVLTKYEYDKKERTISIGGLTDNFKFLAQEILSLKSEAAFSEVKVDTIARTKDGKIAFELKVSVAGDMK